APGEPPKKRSFTGEVFSTGMPSSVTEVSYGNAPLMERIVGCIGLPGTATAQLSPLRKPPETATPGMRSRRCCHEVLPSKAYALGFMDAMLAGVTLILAPALFVET